MTRLRVKRRKVYKTKQNRCEHHFPISHIFTDRPFAFCFLFFSLISIQACGVVLGVAESEFVDFWAHLFIQKNKRNVTAKKVWSFWLLSAPKGLRHTDGEVTYSWLCLSNLQLVLCLGVCVHVYPNLATKLYFYSYNSLLL